MVRKYVFRALCYLYIETIDFFMSLQHQPPHNPLTDLPKPIPVETYLDLLKFAIQTADEPLQLLTESKVTRVRMAKEIKGFAQHEYTLAEVRLESTYYYFRTERTRGAQPQRTVEELKASDDPEVAEMGNTIGLQVGAESTESSPVTKPTASEAPSSASKSTLGNWKPLHHADDLISRVSSFDPPSPDVILHDIHPENLTWLEFITIANLVRSEDKLYSVFGSQCYLYSQLIFLLVQAKFCPGDSERDPPSDSTISVHISRRLSHPDPGRRFIRLDQSKDGVAPGTWMSVLVTVVEISLLEQLRSKFDTRWNDTRQYIERWAEKAANVKDLAVKVHEQASKIRELEAELLKKSQAPTGSSLSSRIPPPTLPRISGRPMSTLSRGLGFGGTGPHTGTWTGPPPSFNSLRAPPPLANQKSSLDRLLHGLGHLFKHK